MTEENWATDRRTPSDWGDIARLAELDEDVPPPGQDSQWKEPSPPLPPQLPLPERALEPGQFNRFGR